MATRYAPRNIDLYDEIIKLETIATAQFGEIPILLKKFEREDNGDLYLIFMEQIQVKQPFLKDDIFKYRAHRFKVQSNRFGIEFIRFNGKAIRLVDFKPYANVKIALEEIKNNK